MSRRAWLKVFDDRVECGSWSIPCESIQDAVVYQLRWLFFPVGVLYLELADESYQFGVNPWAKPWNHLPVPVRTEQAILGWSTFSVVIRLAALAAVVAVVVTRL